MRRSLALLLAAVGGLACAHERPASPPTLELKLTPLEAKASPSLDRALAALDAGDVASAETMLRELFRERGAANALLDAVHRIQGRGGQVPSLLANVPARVVPRPPFDPPSRAGPSKPTLRPSVASRAKVEAAPVRDALAALGDPLYAARGRRGLAEMGGGGNPVPAALPRSYAGVPLVMALPQRDDRWLLLYGRDIGQARYVVVIDARASTSPAARVTVLDFASFLQPPDTIAPRETREAITWAELDGDRLYVANAHTGNLDASRGKNAYVTAIDLTKNAIVWRSAGQVASGGSFVVTEGHVVCAYEDEVFTLFAIDRETGKTAFALPLPVPARALWVEGGQLKGRALDDELTFAGIPGLRGDVVGEKARPPGPFPPLDVPASLPAFALDPSAAQKRATAVARLEAERPLEAFTLLRALVEAEGAAGNFAAETLLAAAERSLEAARASSEESVLHARVVTIASPSSQRAAPVKRGPALRLKKVSEARGLPFRGASIFDERGIPSAEIDKPYPGHAGELPDYVPTRLRGQLLFNARATSGGKTLVAIYGGATVLFDTEGRAAEARLDFTPLGAPAEWPQVSHLEVENDVVIASGVGATPWLMALDRKTGSPYWSSPLAVGHMLLIDGWIVATVPSPPTSGLASNDIVVVDATTGIEASRMRTVRADSLARQGDEIVGGGPTSRVVLRIVRD